MKVIYPEIDLEGLKKRNEMLKEKKDDNIQKEKNVYLFFWMIAILSAFAIAYIYQYARLTKIKNEIVTIRRENRKLKTKINDVELELVKLKDIKRIKKIAKSYGMKEADMIKFIKVE